MSDEEAHSHQRKLRPHPPKASPKESARKGFRLNVADRRRSGEMYQESGSSNKSNGVNYESSASDFIRRSSSSGTTSKRIEENGIHSGSRSIRDLENGHLYSDKQYSSSSQRHHSAVDSHHSNNSNGALEAEIRVLSLENDNYRSRNHELQERLESANSLNAQLEAKLKLESSESSQLQKLKASHAELLDQLEKANNVIQELQHIEMMLKHDLQEQVKEHNETKKSFNKKIASMELVQQQVVMENSRLHSDIRKERTLRQNCEVQMRSHGSNNSSSNNSNKESFVKMSPSRPIRNSDSFLSPDSFSRGRRSPLVGMRTAGKPSSPHVPPLHQHSTREPLPRLEGVIHLENRGRTNQQTFDLFKPLPDPDSFLSPRAHHTQSSSPRRPVARDSARKLKPSPFHDRLSPHRSRKESRNPVSPFTHERDFDTSRGSSGRLSPPFATNMNRASELALARLEKRLLGLHQEKQDREDERTKLERARETVLGRKRKAELEAILRQLEIEISNVKTAIRRLELP